MMCALVNTYMAVTELRFFTIHSVCDSYGQDISHVISAENMFCLFNNTNMRHWFTYVSDIANDILRSLNYIKYEMKSSNKCMAYNKFR